MARMAFAKNDAILVVGGGTWGCSTALHLVRRGYSNVTVLDSHSCPSPISAANDVNKIVETGPVRDSADLEVEEILMKLAGTGWLKDPVFAPYYHETGFIVAASTADGLEYVKSKELSADQSEYIELESTEDFRATMPQGVLSGNFPNWHGWWKRSGAGWVHARKAYVSAATEAQRLGAIFITGIPQGQVTTLLFQDGDVSGAQTADGKRHSARRTIMAAGAYSDLLLDLKKQLRPTAWTLMHIRMRPDELSLYTNLPVLFNVERGFFMEPDEDNHELKICDEHPGYLNYVSDPNVTKSVPFARHQIPVEAEQRGRQFLRETMPQLAERPFSFARICWCADTVDGRFLIDVHPKHPSLVLGIGASGHGFAHIPSVGGLIVDRMEGQLDSKLADAFKWRPEIAIDREWQDPQWRFGGTGEMMDFHNVTGWTDIEDKAK